MARIREYELDRDLELDDKVLGTDASGGGTMNFSIEQLAEFLASRGLADPSALDLQFTYAGDTTPGAIQPGEIYYNASTPADLTEIYISNTDLKGVDTGPLIAALPGTVIDLNDTQASQGSNYGFFNVGGDDVDNPIPPSIRTEGDGYVIPVGLHASLVDPSGTIPSSTMQLPSSEFVNLSIVGLAGAEGGQGPRGFSIRATQDPDTTGSQGETIHHVTISSTEDGVDPFTIDISDGIDGTYLAQSVNITRVAPGTTGADTLVVASDGTISVTLTEHDGGHDFPQPHIGVGSTVTAQHTGAPITFRAVITDVHTGLFTYEVRSMPTVLSGSNITVDSFSSNVVIMDGTNVGTSRIRALLTATEVASGSTSNAHLDFDVTITAAPVDIPNFYSASGIEAADVPTAFITDSSTDPQLVEGVDAVSGSSFLVSYGSVYPANEYLVVAVPTSVVGSNAVTFHPQGLAFQIAGVFELLPSGTLGGEAYREFVVPYNDDTTIIINF